MSEVMEQLRNIPPEDLYKWLVVERRGEDGTLRRTLEPNAFVYPWPYTGLEAYMLQDTMGGKHYKHRLEAAELYGIQAPLSQIRLSDEDAHWGVLAEPSGAIIINPEENLCLWAWPLPGETSPKWFTRRFFAEKCEWHFDDPAGVEQAVKLQRAARRR